MSNPDWNLQVKIKGGRSDTGAHHRAIDVARPGWPGRPASGQTT